MKRLAVLLYAVGCYALFLGVVIYAVGFVGGFQTPTRLDAPTAHAGTQPFIAALSIDLSLVLLFALQHSIMARRSFKSWLTRRLPPSMERSTYVLATNVVHALLFWQWRPLGGTIWSVQSNLGQAVLWLLFAAGWATVFATTCLTNHFDLLGLRQAWLFFRGRSYTSLPFVTPGPYRWVRHPIYVGWLMVFWATPLMTSAHLAFALAMSIYILIAIRFEERDLLAIHGAYRDYRRQVPMLIPSWRKSSS